MEPHPSPHPKNSSTRRKRLVAGLGIASTLLLLLFVTNRSGLPRAIDPSVLSLWIPLLLRWAHLIYGFAWIGASFYFIFVENSLERFPREDALAGRLWAVHGGGVYRLEKYRTAPHPLPAPLHWFRWDAYLTWLTGFALLIWVFYLHPEATLIDRQIAPLSPQGAILGSVAILAGGWLIYEAICATRLLHRPGRFALLSAFLLAALAFGLTHLYSGRGAFLLLGAVLGTIMAGNVLFVIIPSQRRFLQAAQRGESLDPAKVERTHLRSVHNNYLAFPVLFTMMSGHFPFTFLSGANWLVLFCLLLAGGTVRHAVNLRQRRKPWLPWAAGGAALLCGAVVLAQPAPAPPPSAPPFREVTGAQVEAIVQRRCAGCHAAKPTFARFASAPAGILLDSLEGLDRALPLVREQAVRNRAMPPGNVTEMTEEERALLEQWIGLRERAAQKGERSYP